MAGILYVVATPIGNLEDLTFRGLRILKEVDLIAAEDTRRTSKLLAHYAIRKSMVSLREHNERRETPRLIERLLSGQTIALVSDAGTPGISDPGQFLVKAARDAGITVTPIPGPSAVMAALSAAGEPADQFVFLGFIPRSGAQRSHFLEGLLTEPRTVVFFEAPHRVERLLNELKPMLAIRPIYAFKEISKINELSVIYTKSHSPEPLAPVGEFVFVVGQRIDTKEKADKYDEAVGIAVRMFGCLTENSAFGQDEALHLVSTATSLDESAVRKAVKKHRIAAKRAEDSLS